MKRLRPYSLRPRHDLIALSRFTHRAVSTSSWAFPTEDDPTIRWNRAGARASRKELSQEETLKRLEFVRTLAAKPFIFSEKEWYKVRVCPLCKRPHRDEPNNLNTFVFTLDGGYKCHRCGEQGRMDWDKLVDKLTNNPNETGSSPTPRARPLGQYRAARPGALPPTPPASLPDQEKAAQGRRRLQQEWIRYDTHASVQDPEARKVVGFLAKRGLTRATCDKYGIGALVRRFQGSYEYRTCVSLPWMLKAKEIDVKKLKRGSKLPEDENAYVTIRAKERDVVQKANMRTEPAGGLRGLFGWNTLPEDSKKEVYVTEGEFDAMILHQVTHKPCVSVPNGASSLRFEALEMVRGFERVVLWYDADAAGEKAAQETVKALGWEKCAIVRPTLEVLRECAAAQRPTEEPASVPKDANDLFLAGYDLNEILARCCVKETEPVAVTTPPPSTTTTTTMMPMMTTTTTPTMAAPTTAGSDTPIPTTGFPGINRLTGGGFRRGEISVLSGPAGVGKTCFVSQLALDWSLSGIPAAWCTFGSSQRKVERVMASQYARLRADRDLDASPAEVPIPLKKWTGLTPMDRVLVWMTQAVEDKGVQHIVLDDYHRAWTKRAAKTTLAPSGAEPEERDDSAPPPAQDEVEEEEEEELDDASLKVLGQLRAQAMEELMDFAVLKGVHVTLIVHPAKPPAEGEAQDLRGIMPGTPALVNLANKVWTMTRRPLDRSNRSLVKLARNKSLRNTGEIELEFHPGTKCFREIEPASSDAGSSPTGSVKGLG